MKNITLLVTGLLFAGSLASATETKVASVVAYHTPVDYRNAEPVIFMERGIEFMVFPNGEMDFNTQPSTGGSSYYRRAPEGRRNETYGATSANGGVRVEHDYNGKVRRVGNVYINYDYEGRIKRIGSVYMSYNRFALTQIGMLSLVYDRNGRIVDTRGYVNAASCGYEYDPCGNINYNQYDAGYYNNNGNYPNNNNGYNNAGGTSSNYYRKASNNTPNNTNNNSQTGRDNR
jgi:hypothetical protein